MSGADKQPAGASPPELGKLLLETPLYAPVSITKDNKEYMEVLRARNFQFDAHCIYCQKSSTFKTNRSYGAGSGSSRLADPNWMFKPLAFNVQLTCQRKDHTYIYEFHFDGKILKKYGQFPSMEDIASSDIQRFRSVLGNEYFAELRRATGLASHGIGIGSFVYLRRIFERLIYTHHEEMVTQGSPVEGFATMRMDEKIGALSSVLPAALVKNKAAYGILSKGLHELDEDSCRLYFPVVRAAIIQILEQDLEARRRKKAEEDLEREIARISAQLKK
jgi:hypothetical protein